MFQLISPISNMRFAVNPLVSFLNNSLFLKKLAVTSSYITNGMGISSDINSKSALGALFLVLLSITAANYLIQIILFIVVFVFIAFPHARHSYVHLCCRAILDTRLWLPFLLIAFLGVFRYWLC